MSAVDVLVDSFKCLFRLEHTSLLTDIYNVLLGLFWNVRYRDYTLQHTAPHCKTSQSQDIITVDAYTHVLFTHMYVQTWKNSRTITSQSQDIITVDVYVYVLFTNMYVKTRQVCMYKHVSFTGNHHRWLFLSFSDVTTQTISMCCISLSIFRHRKIVTLECSVYV